MKTQLSADIKVGEIVSVLCVKAELRLYNYTTPVVFEALPIQPYEPHEDAELLGFLDYHYHYDWRFFTDDLIAKFFEDAKQFPFNETLYYQNNSIFESPQDWPPSVQRIQTVLGEPFQKELICVREMPFVAPHYTFLKALENAYEGQKLKPGHICPHRGYLTFPVSGQGNCQRICPGHGLGWDDEERLCRRYAE